MYHSESGSITIALSGDTMLTQRLSVYTEERFLALRELLRGAEVAFTNFESSAREYDEGTPGLTGGTYMTTEPRLLEDLKWLGINLLSCANNHAYDYDADGVLANLRHLDAAGMVHAGTGRNLGEARSPAYLETRGGRVALIAVTSTFEEHNRAGAQRQDFRGKPGVSALGARLTYVVDRAAFAELCRTSTALGMEAEKERRRGFGFFPPWELAPEPEGELRFLGRRFVLGDAFAVRSEPAQEDLADILRQVREARRQADWVMVSLHNHEMGGHAFYTATQRTELEETADFVKEFAHRCIDEGAHLFVGHGPHMLLGVELYKGRPIFYSLGDFILQNETVRYFPAHPYERFRLDHAATPADFLDARSEDNTKAHPGHPFYWETACAICRFEEGKLKEISLYPVELGYGRPRAQRGRPLLADEARGRQVIERLGRLSKIYGTEVRYADGRGTIVIRQEAIPAAAGSP